MKQSKHLQNYFVKKYPTGMYSVTFNTHKRWIGYHSYNDKEFKFWTEEDDEECPIDADIQDIEGIPEGSYILTDLQNKDQITFYYIPFESLRYGEIIKEHTNEK